MKRTVTFLVLSLNALYGRATIYPVNQGALSSGLAGIRVGRSDPFSVITHPGLPPMPERIYAGIAFGSRYFTAGLNQMDAAFTCTTKNGLTTGINWSMTGNSRYNEALFKSVCTKPVHRKLNIGVGLDYLRIQLPAEPTIVYHRFLGELGFYFRYSERLDIAMLWSNPTRSGISRDSRERLTSHTTFTLALKSSEDLRLYAAWEQDLQGDGSLSVAAEYFRGNRLVLRTGFSTDPFRPALGMEVRQKNVRIRVGFVVHPVLGVSSGTGLWWGK